MADIRLDKFLANGGFGTRSEVKQLLKKGMVTVNGQPAARPEQKIVPERDQVYCQGRQVSLQGPVYYMLNKPAGYLSATEDRRQPVVLDLVREPRKEELFPVGRLDLDTEGLLLLTNDGALAHGLLSPGKHVDKTYYAEIAGKVTEEDCRSFREGLEIGEKRKTMPAKLVVLETGTLAETGDLHEVTERLLRKQGKDGQNVEYSRIEVTIQEGKYHQVKRMFEAVGKKVVYLKRISMGGLKLDDTLKPGEYRKLTEEETEGLRQNVER